MPKEPRQNNPQPYKYGDKLLDDTHGLNVYDFEARYSDPALANRFWMVDPLAEKYYNWSPYAYCNNNPIKFVDPTGMWYAIAGGYRTENPQDIERFMNARRTSSLTSQTKESALSSIGFDISEPSKEGVNSGRRQQIQQNAQNTIENIEGVTELLEIVGPFGSLIRAMSVAFAGKTDDASLSLSYVPLLLLDGATMGKGSGFNKILSLRKTGLF